MPKCQHCKTTYRLVPAYTIFPHEHLFPLSGKLKVPVDRLIACTKCNRVFAADQDAALEVEMEQLRRDYGD